MKFGTYFAYWEQEWEADYLYYCEKAARLGFDVLEIAAGALADMDDSKLRALKKSARDAGISLTACIGLPERFDVSSGNETVRRNGAEYMKKIISNLEKAGVSVFGGIVYAYWPCDYGRPVDKPAVWARSVESVRELADFSLNHGVSLMIETVNRFEHFLINSAAEAVRYIKDVDRSNVKILLDSFHMNIEEDFIGEAIRSAGEHLGHFHIGECNRKVPGKGHMPWEEIGRALGDISYGGAVVMEPFVRMGGGVGRDIKVWRDLSGNAGEDGLDADIAAALQFVKQVFNKH